MVASRREKALPYALLILAALSFVRAEGCIKSPTSSDSAGSSGPSGSAPTVAVYLTSGGVEYFQYSGFGGFPYEVQTPSCTLNRFGLTSVEQVFFYGRTASSCRDGGLCWDITITSGGRSYSGWANNCDSTLSVRGTDPSSGAAKSVRWSNISRIDLR